MRASCAVEAPGGVKAPRRHFQDTTPIRQTCLANALAGCVPAGSQPASVNGRHDKVQDSRIPMNSVAWKDGWLAGTARDGVSWVALVVLGTVGRKTLRNERSAFISTLLLLFWWLHPRLLLFYFGGGAKLIDWRTFVFCVFFLAVVGPCCSFGASLELWNSENVCFFIVGSVVSGGIGW